MKRKTALTSVFVMTAAFAFAAPISPEMALQRAAESGLMPLTTRSAGTPKLKMTMNASDGRSALYIFDNEGNNGYSVISADDMTIPVLGYADQGSFDAENMAPALKYWLEQYTRQIQYARENPDEFVSTRVQEGVTLPNWSAIAPKIATRWGQGNPYNLFTPMDGNVHSNTGCVATAMSQVMKYFKYPAKGQGSIEYTYGNNRVSLNFSELTFDWNNMLNTYSGANYTQAQADAVATLMKAAGYSVQMNYSANVSGAISGLIPGALIKYFNYDKGLNFQNRNSYTYTEWATMIYNNLSKIGPVIYDGTGTGGGHSFVCDGYQGNGYFHFNWGWSGLSDGYFILDALSPSALGTGGGTGGFIFDQDIILGIQPAKDGAVTPQKDVIMLGSLKGSVSGGNLTLSLTEAYTAGWKYIGTEHISINFGAAYVRADDPNATPTWILTSNLTTATIELDPSGYWPSREGYDPVFNLNKVSMETGVDYKFIIGYREIGGDWKPFPTEIGCFNYVLVSTNGNRYSVKNEDPLTFTAEGLKFNTELYANNAVEVSGTIINNTNTELTRPVALALITANNQIGFIGDTFLLSISPNSKVEETWATPLTRQSGVNVIGDTEFYPGLYDRLSGSFYYKASEPVIMHPDPGTPGVNCKSVVVDDAPFEDGVFIVEDASDFSVTSTITITSGYFSYPLMLGILQPSGNANAYSIPMSINYGIVFINAGETVDLTIPVSFPSAQLDEIYYVTPMVMEDGHFQSLQSSISTRFRVTGFGGVESVVADADAIQFIHDRYGRALSVLGGENGIESVTAYTLNGATIPLKVDRFNGNAVVDLSTLGKGIVIVKATDVKGNTSSIKLAL